MSRRTETAYKAGSPGKSAPPDEAHGFRRQGKCCGCVATVHVLIRGDLSGLPLSMLVAAPCMATCRGVRAGVSISHSRRRTLPPVIRQLETSREEPRKPYPAEGPNAEQGRSPNELS